MLSKNKSNVPHVDTTDRSSTGITRPPLIPVDGEHSMDGTGVTTKPTLSTDGPSQPVERYAASLESSSYFQGVEGESPPIKTSDTSKPSKPEMNWLVVLGEG